jgi:hypothetical protein
MSLLLNGMYCYNAIQRYKEETKKETPEEILREKRRILNEEFQELMMYNENVARGVK